MDGSERNTLLAHLAWKLTDRHEDIAVEALGFILKSEATRRTLQQVLRDGGADVPPIVRVSTQVHGPGSTRPDLVGFDGQGEETVLIEAKFWAGLTDNQPESYLRRLKRGRTLLFVAPASRTEALWGELRQRAEIPSSTPSDHLGEIKAVSTPEDRRMMLTSWADLLRRLELAGDEGANFAIRQLRGLAKRVDDSSFPPLRKEELGPDLPRRLLGMRKLVDDATARGQNEGFMRTKGLNVTSRPTGYGRYLRIEWAGAWFGLDFQRWARGSYPDTPIWLSLREWRKGRSSEDLRARMKPRTLANPPRCLDEGERFVVPVHLRRGVEYGAVLDSVVEQLASVAEDLQRPPA